MPKAVDDLIRRVMSSPGVPSKSAAIAILKKNGTIKQSGKHLVLSGKKKK